MSDRIEIPEDDVIAIPTEVPGVLLVTKTLFGGGMPPNWATHRILWGRDGYPSRSFYGDSDSVGPAVGLVLREDDDDRIKNLSGPQRVAIELAADGEWDAFGRSVARISEGGPVPWPR